jgi:hypothetical protein
MPSCRDPSEPAFNFGKDGRRILEAEPADASGLARTSVGATPEVSGHRARQRTPLDDPDQTTDLVRALDRRRKLSAPEATTARHRAWAGTVPKRVPEPADVPGRQRTLSEYLCWSGRGYGQPSTCVDDSPSSLNPRVRGSSPWRRTRMQVCDLRELTGLEPVFFVGDRCGRQVGVGPRGRRDHDRLVRAPAQPATGDGRGWRPRIGPARHPAATSGARSHAAGRRRRGCASTVASVRRTSAWLAAGLHAGSHRALSGVVPGTTEPAAQAARERTMWIGGSSPRNGTTNIPNIPGHCRCRSRA